MPEVWYACDYDCGWCSEDGRCPHKIWEQIHAALKRGYAVVTFYEILAESLLLD